MRTLLLGMGNPILSDDAVGVRLAADFARRLRDVPDLVVVPECSAGGLALLDIFEGYERAIVLDSVQATPASPGRWHRFDACALRESQHLTNVHDANFATTLELGRRLGIHLPDDSAIHIFAVEVADAVTFSDRMTAPLEAGYPIYSQQIFNEVLGLLVAPARGPAPHFPRGWRCTGSSVATQGSS
jgi:hydrogenase maturation protease